MDADRWKWAVVGYKSAIYDSIVEAAASRDQASWRTPITCYHNVANPLFHRCYRAAVMPPIYVSIRVDHLRRTMRFTPGTYVAAL